MSEFTDDTLNRYLDQQPGMRQALLHDPAQKMQAEVLRQTLDMVERAMANEGVPDDVRRRVTNRVVWGEPEGRVDRYAVPFRCLCGWSTQDIRHERHVCPEGVRAFRLGEEQTR